MFPEFSARTEFPRTSHPGTVTFVGTDGTQRVEPADHIPDWLKFAPGPDGTPVPVVRVVRLQTDRGYSLRSYGADGHLLWVGLTVASTPPAQTLQLDQSSAVTRAPQLRQPPAPRPLANEPSGWF